MPISNSLLRRTQGAKFTTSFVARVPAAAHSAATLQSKRCERRNEKPAMSVMPTVDSTGVLPLLLADTSLPLQAGLLLAGPLLNIFNFIMVVRIILTWYPQTNLTKAPWIFIAVPTEPLLRAMRKIVQPIGGVDISPIVWFAIGSFVHEILVGPQGLLVLLAQK